MLDGEHYNTLREDLKFSNLGPGYYDLKDNWTPSSFIKYGKPIARNTKSPVDNFVLTLNKSYNSITHKDKPWQQKSRPRQRMSAEERARNPFDTSDMDAAGDHQRELQQDILSVHKLPEYYK